MPELPEMENYRRLLTNHITNIPIRQITVNREKSINIPADEFSNTLIGAKIIFVERRGKYLIFHMNDGRRLLLHLMLGGLLYMTFDNEARPSRSTQIEIHFGDRVLYFIGLRLGYLHLLTAKETDQALSRLGPDMMGRRMNKDVFIHRAAERRSTLKSMLVNQQAISGIGNCYADEIAFHAGIHPAVKVQQLPSSSLEKLYNSALLVLNDAIEHGGYMELPFSENDDLTGNYNEKCKVYDREGQPCVTCGNPINKLELSGRKVFLCPVCQPENV
ncbi:DNA-formamidopyrimidine glycosylase [Paenibacillus lemnae]|uniref:Formamidopyrimidine-DNA glycosylase n=1 Tax=Paenibacillus lemnae TaxID=1330551 RepID=A0A848M7V7_PAELE|nr:DNA-formamidopyrimidine glycosylase [Paenibacillus lemnae]NMO95963.1 DNA-formamidopyrimidine glycosylase [Paenibacillus lemnae]